MSELHNIAIEYEVKVLKEQVDTYQGALLAAFGIYTANPRATLLQIAREWAEDRRALLALTGQRCVICQAPATRELPRHETYFCDDHDYGQLPQEMKEALSECGVPEVFELEDIPFAASVRRAIELSSTPCEVRN